MSRRPPNRRRALLVTVALALGLVLAPPSEAAGPADPASVTSSPAVPVGRILDHVVARAAARSEGRYAPLQVEGSSLTSFTRFTLDPAATAVHVLFDATITNLEPPSLGYYYTSYSYLPRLGIPVMKEAVNVTASKQDGTPLAVAMEGTESPFVSIAVIDLEPDLYYQDAAAIRLTYDLPPMAARAESFTRLNAAFATFPVFALGDPGATSVEVVIPERFDVELIGSRLDRTERDGQQVFAETSIADPDVFGVDVVARDDAQLLERSIELGKHDAIVRGWPGDDQWVDFVAEQTAEGVPELGELLGIEWPAEDDLEIVETVSPYLYGYAGWYQASKSVIEVGDKLDQHVILHELAHLWFNDDLYGSRWINEGLADVYSARVITALGGSPAAPAPIDPAAPGAVTLNVWEAPYVQTTDSFAAEQYGYNASWAVIEQLAAEIGIDKLSAVVRASKTRALPYAAASDDRPLPIDHTWHQFLDLLTSVGGSTTAETVFRAHVAAPTDVASLDARIAARATFDQLLTDGPGWAPPFAVRRAMSMWNFRSANELMDQTRTLLPILEALASELGELGIDLPDHVRLTYERANDLDALGAALERHLAAVRSYKDAVEARGDASGPLALVGLAFTRTDLRLIDARLALAEGDFARAARSSEAVASLADDATEAGLARAAALALLVAMALFVRRSGAAVPTSVAGPLHRTVAGVVHLLPSPQVLWRFVTERHAEPHQDATPPPRGPAAPTTP